MSDNANHPFYYKRDRRKECIVEMQEKFGLKAVAAIVLHRYTKIVFTMFPVGMGIMALFRGIETRKQRQEKEERIKAQARVLGWEDDDCNGNQV